MKDTNNTFQPSTNSSVNYYNRFTQLYLENNQNPADFIDEFIQLLQSKKSERKTILDLGCGPGINSGYMHSRNFQVVGMDLSEKMIEHAKLIYQGIDFLLGDMTELSFPLNSFDGVFASYSLIHIPKERISLVFAKIYEILKPDGIIYLSVQSGESTQGFYSHPLTPSEKIFLNIFSQQEIINILSKYGFKVISKHQKVPSGKVFGFTKLFIIGKKL